MTSSQTWPIICIRCSWKIWNRFKSNSKIGVLKPKPTRCALKRNPSPSMRYPKEQRFQPETLLSKTSRSNRPSQATSSSPETERLILKLTYLRWCPRRWLRIASIILEQGFRNRSSSPFTLIILMSISFTMKQKTANRQLKKRIRWSSTRRETQKILLKMPNTKSFSRTLCKIRSRKLSERAAGSSTTSPITT